MKRDLFLLSNSTAPGLPPLAHARDALAAFLDGRTTIHFAPYAQQDHDRYTADQQNALAPLGVKLIGLHTLADEAAALESTEVLFVGGGNSFRLLKNLQERGLIEPVRRRVLAGDLLYMGSSAGTNMSCPSLRTTNDMPIVQPASFGAFDLIPFQINPHFLDADPNSTHEGETREDRLTEFLEENEVPVLGLREGAWLRVEDQTATLGGPTGAVLFRRGESPLPLAEDADLSFLLETTPRFDTR